MHLDLSKSRRRKRNDLTLFDLSRQFTEAQWDALTRTSIVAGEDYCFAITVAQII